MSSLHAELPRLRLDPTSYERLRPAGFASRWVEMSSARQDVES